MIKGGPAISLPENEFRLLRDLISEYCGIYYDDDSRNMLQRRLERRLNTLGILDFRDYYRYLLYNSSRDEELSEIIDILTVNETYFFREERQFKALMSEIIPEIKSTMPERRKIRIWSAGCASGEEPYTIAICVLENRHLLSGFEVEILGSDINRRVLDRARRGVYTPNSFRGENQQYIRKYFDRLGNDYKIKDEVKELVSLSYINLFDLKSHHFIGDVDIIFCRNVLIYFNLEAKKRVVQGFSRRLNDGGYLLLGHAESLINVSTRFTLKHLKNDMVYQKPRRITASLSDDGLFDMLWGGDGK